MNDNSEKTYRRGPTERIGRPTVGAADLHGGNPSAFNRRQFLEAAGFTISLAAANGCGRAPVEHALPFAVQPEGVIPGRTRSYASTCAGCAAGCGLLVGVRDGRPLKMEGMPEHPLSNGGLCAIGQALPLGLYDSHRLSSPMTAGKPAEWTAVDQAIVKKLESVARDGAVLIVTPTVTSPTLRATIDAFRNQFDDARHVVVDAVSSSAILDAHQQTHGIRVLPRYRFDRSKVIVSLGADFLGTWISPVEFTSGWKSMRIPAPDRPQMSYHVQLESRLSLTGSNADKRIRIAPNDHGSILAHLAVRLSQLAGGPRPKGDLNPSILTETELDALVRRLWNARGECLVLSDSQDADVQQLVNFIQETLGNYGRTVDIQRPSLQRQGNDAAVIQMMDELKAGKVAALFVAGTDLTHNLPRRDELIKSIGKVPLVVSLSERNDDFTSLAHYVCPDHHPLESWMDAEPIRGLVTLAQPTLAPLGQTRSVLESFARWTGRGESARDILQASWREDIHMRAETSLPFRQFWDEAVHNGFVELATPNTESGRFRPDIVKLPRTAIAPDGFDLVLYAKVGMTDSRHAHNAWLQELPDPVTKVTWDNYVCISPAHARDLGVVDGDLVRVEVSSGDSLELPAFVQPGQHDRVLAVALGYGVKGTERFSKIGPQWLEARPTVASGERVGENAAGFVSIRNGNLHLSQSNVSITKVRGRRILASTQEHHTLEVPPHIAPHGAAVRDIVQETSLAEYAKDPAAGAPEHHHDSQQQLWPDDHPKLGHWWGMTVDLNACTGCSACLIACQSENNVPVVGKDEVRRQREMHWIRIDRYYSGADDELEVLHQPMMCQHCDNAPCETVCPVLATVHGEEGLNEQAYNRCVGTRYCANNCPYKVRRFNWFRYEHGDPLQTLALNPDVTVRRRGVMEKCSMCVQRIEEGRMEAKRLGGAIEDGTIQTACQQSCPAQAITFGDMNDPNSRIHSAMQDARHFRVLEEFNFRPSVGYLRAVRNHEAVESGPDPHERGDHV